MVKSVFMGELSWPEFQAKMAAQAPVFLAIGATEQHGPHLPLSVDVILPTAVCERVAKEVGGIVAPSLTYGYKSQPRCGGGQHFPGTTSLDMNTLTLMIRDVIYDLGMHGMTRLVVINGHFENTWPIIEGIDLGRRQLRHEGLTELKTMRLEYWDFVRRETLDKLFPDGFPGTELEHASLLETSMMLLVRPDLVEMDKIPTDGPAQFPTYDVYPMPAGFVPDSGVLARAQGSTAEKGQWLMDDHVSLITAAVRKEFDI